MGAAVAIDLAARKPVAALIIESPFLAAFRTLTQVPLLLFDKFNNLAKIKKVKCPVLIIHGKKDSVIPFWQGEKLYREANPPKDYFWIEGAGHNDIMFVDEKAYWHAINKFIAGIQQG